jgi:hypothetical protein
MTLFAAVALYLVELAEKVLGLKKPEPTDWHDEYGDCND